MADLFDYLNWRGDLPFSSVPLGCADALILSALAYLKLEGIVSADAGNPVPLYEVNRIFSLLPDRESRVRIKQDLSLLDAAARSPRLAGCRLCCYRSKLIASEQTQFAAVTFLLQDGSAFLAFRGTDYSLVGWKEDFNMSFSTSVPAQREAAAYVREMAGLLPMILHLGGHSKGGNLAVYAAATAPPAIQSRISCIYNLDGPGFTKHMLANPGYLRVVPRIRTYVPESSIIGILLEHKEPYTVIRSRQVGILQHEPYSWEIMAGGFIPAAEMSAGSRFADRAITGWIEEMSDAERSRFVDMLYDLLRSGGATNVGDLLQPKSIRAILQQLTTSEQTRRCLLEEFSDFIKAAVAAIRQQPER